MLLGILLGISKFFPRISYRQMRGKKCWLDVAAIAQAVVLPAGGFGATFYEGVGGRKPTNCPPVPRRRFCGPEIGEHRSINRRHGSIPSKR